MGSVKPTPQGATQDIFKMNSTARAIIYFLFLTLTFPMVLVLLVIPSLFISMITRAFQYSQTQQKLQSSKQVRKTVLVTGAPHTKGLQICRFLASAGHRVVLADMKKFRWSASRFSNCVSKWVTLPNVTPGDSEGYRKAIRTIISKETVDWWIPVSHTSTAVVDSAIKKELEITNPFVKVLSIDNVETADMLDDKILFLEEAKAMGLVVPEFYKISCCQDVTDLCKKGIFNRRHFFLKPLSPYSEDRVCFTRIPDNEPELLNYLKSYQHKIAKDTPYFVSEFVQGDEYTGNVLAKDGQIYVYTSNPSSPMQIDYDDASDKKEIFTWVQTFVSEKKLSGSLCFDFLEHPLTGAMMAIECNPRLHSCIVLMDTQREAAAEAIYRTMEGDNNNSNNAIAVPDPNQKHVFWFHNEVGKLLEGTSLIEVMSTIINGKDATWDVTDPLPFFLLPHLQIPTLLWAKIVTGENWSIVNFCLGQLR